MPTEKQRVLPKPLEKLMGDFQLHEGQMSMPQKRLLYWRDRLLKITVLKTEKLIIGLLAAATKLQQEGGESALDAVAQLCALSAVLMAKLGTDHQVDDALQDAAVQKRTEQFLGNLGASNLAPREGERPSAAAGMLNFLGKSKK